MKSKIHIYSFPVRINVRTFFMSKFNDFAGKWQNKIDDFAEKPRNKIDDFAGKRRNKFNDFAVKIHGMLFFRPFAAYI